MLRRHITAAAVLAGSMFAQGAPVPPPAPKAPAAVQPEKKDPARSKSDLKLAERHYKLGLKDQKKSRLRQAFEEFKLASELAPESVTYVSAREAARQSLTQKLLDDGNQQMQSGQTVAALALFREALEVDPGNSFARQRIYDAMPTLPALRVVRTGRSLVALRPPAVRKTLRLQGMAPQALETLAKTYGLTAFVDPSVQPRPINLTLNAVTWDEALDVVSRYTHTFSMPLASNQVMFAADDDSTRRELQRMGMETFRVYPSSPQELTDVTNTLRVLFDIRYLSASPAEGTITVRAPQPVIETAEQFLSQLQDPRPAVLLDFKVYAVSRSLAREIGTDIPNSFTVFNVPTEAQKLLGGQSIQSILAQLQSGGISQALAGGLAGLLGQALGGGGSSPITSPFVTFGGGLTLTGIDIAALSARLNRNESTLHSLQQVSVRAMQGTPATVKVGQRYPIVTATFGGTFTLPGAASNLLGNTNSIVPNIQYEDLGLDIKATPRVSRSGLVSVDLEMQIRSLQGQQVNGMPVLTNQEFKTSMSTRDGESIGVAGLISKAEYRTMAGIPLLGQIPITSQALSDVSNQKNDDEILVVMTPHIVTGARQNSQALPMPNGIQR